MKKLKEVTLFSHGDANLLSTWSNVPYLFSTTLRAKGIIVNTVDLNPWKPAEKIYDYSFWRVMNKIKKGFFTTYLHSYLNHIHANYKIRKAVKKYKNSEIFLFLTFSNSVFGISDKPSILFCDWNIEYYFHHFLQRTPGFFESFSLKRQDKIIESADLVISLFPRVAAHMKNYYHNPNIYYLGNVVNAVKVPDIDELIRKKVVSKNIVFIGNRKYFHGAKILIEAFLMLRENIPDVKLDIIGMNADLFHKNIEGVTFHGYLDKSNDEERAEYYSILENAKVIVNTTPKWGAFSSMIEAMYFCTPVITTPYSEFIETFGNDITFGQYSDNNSPTSLQILLIDIFNDIGYVKKCIEAHDAVKDFTWDKYIDRILGVIEQTCKIG